jgi:hypothetical protein
MARATGRRLAAGLCFFFGGITVVLIPVLWPIGWRLWKDAKGAEQEREEERELLREAAED